MEENALKLFLLYIIFAVLSCAAYFVKKRLHKIDQSQFSDEDALRIYEGKLLVCPYRDEALSPQLIFDTSQLEDRGLMAMIYVNED